MILVLIVSQPAMEFTFTVRVWAVVVKTGYPVDNFLVFLQSLFCIISIELFANQLLARAFHIASRPIAVG